MAGIRAPHQRRLRRVALAGIVLCVALVGFPAAPALAHNSVLSTNPEAGSVVTEQPGVISITTNDSLLDLSGAGESNVMQISGPADDVRYYGDGCSRVLGPSLETEVQLGQPGEYTVAWQVVSTDSHSISDEFTFTWEPDATQVLAEGSSTAPTCGSAEGSDDAAGPEAGAADAAESGSAVDATDLLWIGGAFVAILAAIIGTLLALRRRPTP